MEAEIDINFIKGIFEKTGAIMKGHFKLSSGLHSDTYIQCARVSVYPEFNFILSNIIAKKFKKENIDAVIGPALGGIIIAYEIAKQLCAKALFAERDENKKMSLRRGFEIEKNWNLIVVEDVITTGNSVREVIEIVKKNNANVVGVASFINRSSLENEIDGIPLFSVLKIEAPVWEPDSCPLCQKNIPIIAPGSKYLK
jgi:orotate phosphoribosyltransferase